MAPPPGQRVTAYPAPAKTGAARLHTVDQTVADAAPDIGGNDHRASILVQNVGTTPIAVGFTAADAPNGIILAGGTAPNNGTGGAMDFDDYTGALHLYDVTGGGATARSAETLRALE